MSYQEKRSIVSLASTLLTTILYSIYVYNDYYATDFSSASLTQFWAATILILIPVLMVFKIVIHIIFNIINKIATNEDEPKFTDELDKLIELKSTRNTHILMMVLFLLSMVTLIAGMSLSTFFVTLAFAMVGSCILNDVSQIYFYRRGV